MFQMALPEGKKYKEKSSTYQLSKMYFPLVTAKITTELKTEYITTKASGYHAAMLSLTEKNNATVEI